MKKTLNNILKATTFCILGISVFSSCKKEISEPVDYLVTLDKGNTYYAGDVVKFNIDGSVDNLLFYSGEQGSQYKYKDRYSVAVEDVNSAVLNIKYQAKYGNPDGLEVWVSKEFTGLNGKDAAADKATMAKLYADGMPGWTKLEYNEGGSGAWTTQEYPANDYLDNFCVAFHWKPIRDGKSAQRTYWVDGGITLDMAGTAPTTMGLGELGFTTVMMNDEISNPYIQNNGNGTIILNKPTTAAIIFQGVGATTLSYGLDGWCVSKPSPLNKVANDQALVAKNIQNYLHSYEYTFEEPGTYTVTFVGINANYSGTTKDVQQMEVTILEKPIE